MIKKNTLGLDLGQRSIKGVLLHKRKKRVFLDNAFIFDYAESNPNFPNNADTALGLKALSEIHGLNKYDVIFNIGNYNINSFDLKLPAMPKKDLSAIIRNEVAKHINYAIEKCSFDYTASLDESSKEKMYNIKVFTTKLSKVNANTALLYSANLKPYILDADIEAIARMLSFNGYLKEGHCHILVDMGETHTTVALLLGKQVISLTVIKQSMGLISHNLIKSLSINYGEAESFKKDLSSKDNNPFRTSSPIGHQMAKEDFDEILSKIQENIDYLSEFHFKKWPVEAFFFTGGGSKGQGLCELFEEHYKIKCLVPNPFKNIELAEDSDNKNFIFNNINSMATSVGLALRGVT